MNIAFNKIENGLTIACDQMDNVQSVSLSIMVKVGGRDETPEQYGLSHFIEHMAFKGTSIRDKKRIAYEMDALGGSYNAYTGKEHTCYVSKIPAIYFNEAFEVFADIITNSSYDDHEITPERDVILQEISMIQDDPSDIIFDKFYETCFKDQAFGTQIIGPASNVKKFQRNDFIDYTNQFYKNENIIIGAAGNVSFEELLELSLKYFPGKNLKFSHHRHKPNFTGGDYREERDTLEQVHIVMGFPGIAKTSDDYMIVKLASMILGGGMSSRLFQEIRENLGLAYSVSAFHSGYKDCGVFTLYGAVAPEKANIFIEKSLGELHKMVHDLKIEELEKVKKQMRCAILMSTDGTKERLGHLIASIDTHGRYLTNEELLHQINAINIDDIVHMIKKITHSKVATLASIGQINGVMKYEEFLGHAIK